MTIPFKSQLSSRMLSKLGESATLTEYAEGSTDAHGDIAYTPTTRAVTIIPSTATNTRMPFIRRGELGNYLTMQMEFFMSDQYEPPNLAVDKAPVLIHEGLEYEIIESENAKNGLVRMLGYRKRV